MIREQIPLGVYGGKLGSHRHIFVGGELQVFRHRRAVCLGQQVEFNGDGIAAPPVGKDRGELELSLQAGRCGQRGEAQSVHRLHSNHVAHLDALSAQGETADRGIRQSGDHNAVQLAGAFHNEVLLGKGDGFRRRAVFGHGRHGWDRLIFLEEKGRCRPASGVQDRRQHCQRQSAAQKDAVFQDNYLLVWKSSVVFAKSRRIYGGGYPNRPAPVHWFKYGSDPAASSEGSAF